MENTKDATAAHRIRQSGQKTVHLPDGTPVRIRKVGKYELLATGVLGPVLSAAIQESDDGGGPMTEKQKSNVRAAVAMRASEWAKTVRQVVAVGMVDPPVWQGAEADCPDTHVMPYDLSDAEDFIANEILSFSGWEVGITKAATFRDPEEASAEAPASSSSDGQERLPTLEEASR